MRRLARPLRLGTRRLVRPLLVGMGALAVALLAATFSAAAPRMAEQGGGGSSSISVLFGAPAGEKVLAQYDIPVASQGELSIAFHGSRAAGCVRQGLCDYTGQTTLRPQGRGDLTLVKFRHHRRTSYLVFLDLGGYQSGPGLVSHVSRFVGGSEAGLCADAVETNLGNETESKSGRVTLRLVQSGAGALSTRCAGPLDGDVSRAVPHATVSVRSLMHPGTHIRLVGIHGFAGHGLAGTVHSTIMLTLGKSRHQHIPTGPPKGKTTRLREVSESFHVLPWAADGLSAAFSSDPQVCRLLDSCGMTGTIDWAPAPTHSTLVLTATGLASRPLRDFKAALGLDTGKTHGILVDGGVTWRAHTTVTERVTQGGTCTDTAPLGAGGLFLSGEGSRIDVGYTPLDSLRTRCPGPILQSDTYGLAGASIPVKRFSPRHLRITLAPQSSNQDDGYSVSLSGHFSLVLKRSGRLKQQVFKVPGSFGSEFQLRRELRGELRWPPR